MAPSPGGMEAACAVRQQGRAPAGRLGVHPVLPSGDHGAADQAGVMQQPRALHRAPACAVERAA